MDEAEFDRWYDASFPRIVGQITALIGDRAEAQDCAQEAFVRAWDLRVSLASHTSMDAWCARPPIGWRSVAGGGGDAVKSWLPGWQPGSCRGQH